MRILHLINHCGRANGNVHAAVDIACTQSLSGHNVVLASIGGDFEELLQRCGVRHAVIAQNLRRPTLAIKAVRQTLALQREFKADIVHAHMMSGALIGYVVSRIGGVPLVTTVHNSHESHARIMNVGDAVVAVSEAEGRRLAMAGFRREKLRVVRNGPLGSPRYAPVAGPPPERRRTIISICGLHARKGVSDILDAFAAIAADHPDWALTIAGEGPDRDALIVQGRALGIESRTTFLGKVIEPMPLLAASEIFVIASRAEPFGLVAVEARAAGCAIVGTKVGGIPEVLDFGSAGILVDPSSPSDIAAALRRLIEDQALRLDYQARAAQGLDAFATERQMGDYDLIYRELIAARSDGLSPARLSAESLDMPSP